ncbi:MAG: hypothetical protein ACQGVC_18250 [Myxococcota bacterium]
MAWARTKTGELRCAWQGEEYHLTVEAQEIPDDLAENIAPHVNVEVSSKKPEAPKAEKAPEPKAGKGAEKKPAPAPKQESAKADSK